MRLFLAVFPSKEFRDYFREVYREFAKQKRNLKPINFEQIHLTIRFIGGNVSDHSKHLVINELRSRAGSFSKPVIEIDKLEFGFPRQHDPRILFATIKGNDELDALVDESHRIIRQVGRKDILSLGSRIWMITII
jgi:2'-5' RNA ligase